MDSDRLAVRKYGNKIINTYCQIVSDYPGSIKVYRIMLYTHIQLHTCSDQLYT